jgi:hypothetical protein
VGSVFRVQTTSSELSFATSIVGHDDEPSAALYVPASYRFHIAPSAAVTDPVDPPASHRRGRASDTGLETA